MVSKKKANEICAEYDEDRKYDQTKHESYRKKFRSEQLTNVQGEMLLDFSSNQKEVMPTKLGNIFKAFENYSQRRYGIDSVIFWPRLIRSIPESYCERLEESHNCIIFLLVSSFIFGFMAIESFLIVILWHCSTELLWMIKILAVICLLMSMLFYRISLRATRNFGEVVKSCFDLFRHDLLNSLGIEKPLSLAKERELWGELRKFILSGEGNPFEKHQP